MVKYVLPISQILQSFTEGTARKFSVSFAFCAHFGIINMEKLTFFFGRVHITRAFVLSVPAIVKLQGATLNVLTYLKTFLPCNNAGLKSHGWFVCRFMARKDGFTVCPNLAGHGVGTMFHGPPEILHTGAFFI